MSIVYYFQVLNTQKYVQYVHFQHIKYILHLFYSESLDSTVYFIREIHNY